MNTATNLSLVIFALLTTAAGCTQSSEDGPDQAEAEAVARTTGRTVTKAGRAVATLQTTMKAGLEDSSANLVAADLRARVEAAIAELVAGAQCVSLHWSSLVSVNVQFDDCMIPTTDEKLDGALGVRIRPLDRSVELLLENLAVGSDIFDGRVRGYVRGPLGALTLGIDATLTLVNDDTTIAVDGLDVAANLDGVTLSGSGAVTSSDTDTSATADQLHWILGDCLPSSGTVSLESDRVSGVITFLATTPVTGEVQLQLPKLPPVTMGMFPTCN